MQNTRGRNQIKSEAVKPWTEEEEEQLVDWVSGQSKGTDYESYKKTLDKIDWTKCPIANRSPTECKEQFMKMIENVKKSRTLSEFLTYYLNTYLKPRIKAEEMASIEIADDNSNHVNEIQQAQPFEEEATINVPEKQAIQNKQTERAGEVKRVENLDKKIKREKTDQFDQTDDRADEVAIIGNYGKRGRRKDHIQQTERAAGMQTAESSDGIVNRENPVNPTDKTAEVESPESRGKRVKRKNEMIKTEPGAEVERVKKCNKCGKQKRNVMKFTVTKLN